MRIIIEDYNPGWSTSFIAERDILIEAFGGIRIHVEHIGSTSVQGLAAKPVIDIMLGLEGFALADKVIDRIEKLAYVYVSKYEDVMPHRRFFIKDINGKRTHHIHMVEIGTEFWKRHLFFRDYLRNNPAASGQYQQLKIELAKREWNDGNEYADAKGEFIKSIEGLARH
jgi:GrpB-like predicted nucleotidyltransferase (UPF0157 family)